MPINRRLFPVLFDGSGGVSTPSKTVTVDNTGNASTLTDYPVKVAVTFAEGMAADFSDVKFKDGGTSLSYWRESYVASTSAVFWVKVPSITGSASKTITMTYGDGSASASNGGNVFSLFNNFDSEIDIPATTAAVSGAYLAENIVFDSVTNKYWWIFQEGTGIRIASADTIDGTWTVQAGNVITDAGATNRNSPFIVKFGSYWYIYYGHNDPGSIYCQKSSSVNTGYSLTGITNPILDVGAGGTWDAARVNEPYVFQIGATYYMFYMGEDATPLEKIGYATASDPLGPWTKYGSNPVISGNSKPWNKGTRARAADPYVFEKDGTYYIGVSADTSAGQQAIGFYKTTDFITFTECANNPAITGAIRGAVIKIGSTYYVGYCDYPVTTGMFLTTLQFNTDADIATQFSIGANVLWNDGIVTTGAGTTDANDPIKSTATFAANYALRSLAKFSATGTVHSVLAFRNGWTGTKFLEYYGNYTSNNIVGANHNTSDALSGNLGTSGAYAIYEILRRDTTSGIYVVDDGTPTAIATQVPSDSFPVMGISSLLIDWILVRPYSYPEPSVTVS